MAYGYKPGEDDDLLKRYVVVAGVVVIVAVVIVITIYLGLGIDTGVLKILTKRIKADATTVTFTFAFVMATLALWGLLREPASSENVQRRQTYFILLLLLAGVLVAGNFFVKRLAMPTEEVTKKEVCPKCGGSGRARLRPEYPCGHCDGTGYVTP
jgi:ribosomal protein S27AE